MKVLLASAVGVLLLGGVTLGALATVLPFPTPFLALHAWVPLPAACAGPSCVTYSQWVTAARRDGERRSPNDVLTALVEDRAMRTVASREGIRVSDEELSQAVDAIHAALDHVPAGTNVLQDVYGPRPEATLEAGLRDLLLREKLAAVGIASPWESRFAPSVTLWNIHLHWDASRRTVVSSSSAAFLAREKNIR